MRPLARLQTGESYLQTISSVRPSIMKKFERKAAMQSQPRDYGSEI